MRFTVPQFIEHEMKIIGPLTFKQFIFVGFAGAICFVIYFIAPKLFLISAIILGGISVSLAFLKIGGRPIPTVLGNFLKFSLTPKTFIWKKKGKAITLKKVEMKKEEKEGVDLKIGGKSQLKDIRTEVETKTK